MARREQRVILARELRPGDVLPGHFGDRSVTDVRHVATERRVYMTFRSGKTLALPSTTRVRIAARDDETRTDLSAPATVTVVAVDQQGIKRAWGTGISAAQAIANVQLEMDRYAKERPDLRLTVRSDT